MKLNSITLAFVVFLLVPGCGGGGGGSSSSSSSGGGSSSQPTNVMLLTVNGSTCDSSLTTATGYINDACVSITVCTPGASTCQTIKSILLDTGSYGLRIFKQALGNVSLSQVTSGSGSLAECVQYADGTSDWGPVQTASVILGSEPAVQVPIQVIDSTFSAIPSLCGPANGYTPDQSPSIDGFNGILGVGPFIYDCGNACVTSSAIGQYYSCSGSNCSATTVTLKNQVQDPVASLPTDNQGLIVELPGVSASGAASLTGSIVFGIGSQSNNSLSGVTAYALDQNGNFITTFNNVSDSGSFIDTGSNGLFFPSPFMAVSGPYKGLLPDCSGNNSAWFCPPTTNSNPDGITPLAATIAGYSGSPTATVPFSIGNYNSITNSSNMVFGDVGGDSPSFDWGLPFFFGRNVYIGFENKASLDTGQYFAY